MATTGPITGKDLTALIPLDEATLDQGIGVLCSTFHIWTTYSHGIWASSSLLGAWTAHARGWGGRVNALLQCIQTHSCTQSNEKTTGQFLQQAPLPTSLKTAVFFYQSLSFGHFALSIGATLIRIPFPAWKGAVSVIGPYTPGGIAALERGLSLCRLFGVAKFTFSTCEEYQTAPASRRTDILKTAPLIAFNLAIQAYMTYLVFVKYRL